MTAKKIEHRFSVAPMLDWTDRHCRYFLRVISQHSVLYTEMVTTGAILFGKGDYLRYNIEEQPLVLQLGGSDAEAMAKCAVIAQSKGYSEVNINVGCPSDRVQNGSFGACLMASPEVVAASVKAMKAQVDIPITVKCRIGIDDMDEDKDLSEFVDRVANAGCEHFIVHARKAWLQGLSPKQNRDIPPLNYERVYGLKESFADLRIDINGGITTLQQAKQHLCHVDGVMMGREVYANPFILSTVDQEIFGDTEAKLPTREEIVKIMHAYIDREIRKGGKVWHIARHMLGLFQGQVGGKIWRRYLTQECPKNNQNPDLILAAFDKVQEAQKRSLEFSQLR